MFGESLQFVLRSAVPNRFVFGAVAPAQAREEGQGDRGRYPGVRPAARQPLAQRRLRNQAGCRALRARHAEQLVRVDGARVLPRAREPAAADPRRDGKLPVAGATRDEGRGCHHPIRPWGKG